MMTRGLIERDGVGLALTDQGRAVLEVMLMGKATRGT